MKIGELVGKKAEAFVYAPDKRLLLPDTKLGLEFEFEDVLVGGEMPEELQPYWAMHAEPSLKRHGMEFVFAQPMFGKDAMDALECVLAAAVKYKWACTKRTGFHVHMDVRNLEHPQLVGFNLIYAIIEPVLFNWIGDRREHSIFCIPWYKAWSEVQHIGRLLSLLNKQSDQTKAHAGDCARYAGLNLQALAKYGSVEFRHMKTTLDINRLMAWINMILSIKQAALIMPTSDGAILEMAERDGGRRFVGRVFGDLAPLLDYPNMDDDVLNVGLPVAQELIHGGFKDNVWGAVEFPKGKHPATDKLLAKKKEEPQPKKEDLAVLRRQVEAMIPGPARAEARRMLQMRELGLPLDEGQMVYAPRPQLFGRAQAAAPIVLQNRPMELPDIDEWAHVDDDPFIHEEGENQ